MSTRKRTTDLAKLEGSHLALNNAISETKISDSLVQVGFSIQMLQNGLALQSLASNAFARANAAQKRRKEAYADLCKKADALEELFKIDRGMLKIAFMSDPEAWNKLELDKPLEKKRLELFEMSKTFYTVLSEKPDLLETLSKLGFSTESVTARLEAVAEVEKARANFLFEKGVSQNATISKNKAIKTLTKWMSQFNAIARVAFKHEPQMMEALGIVVKN